MNWRYELNKAGQRLTMWVAWHMIPRPVRMWVVVRAYAKAWETAKTKTPDELTYREIFDAIA